MPFVNYFYDIQLYYLRKYRFVNYIIPQKYEYFYHVFSVIVNLNPPLRLSENSLAFVHCAQAFYDISAFSKVFQLFLHSFFVQFDSRFLVFGQSACEEKSKSIEKSKCTKAKSNCIKDSVYIDEGISVTDLRYRSRFNQVIQDRKSTLSSRSFSGSIFGSFCLTISSIFVSLLLIHETIPMSVLPIDIQLYVLCILLDKS